ESATFRAWDETLARDVAIKTVAGDVADLPNAERRLIAEARITGSLSHPGVVPVHDLALDAAGRPCFTMRWVQGATFRDVIERVAAGSHGFTLARAVDALRAACDTVAFAHSRGVVHGALTPERVV